MKNGTDIKSICGAETGNEIAAFGSDSKASRYATETDHRIVLVADGPKESACVGVLAGTRGLGIDRRWQRE